MNVIDFSTLPAPKVIEEISFEKTFTEMLADLLARHPEFSALVESDPAFKILEVCAYRETLLRQRVNDGCRSVMLAYATGGDLDNLAALFNVERKVITPEDKTTIPPTAAVLEDDTALRRRVLLSLDGLATAGSKNSYIFHTLTVPEIRDAAVMSPPDAGIAPGNVHVYCLGYGETGNVSEKQLQDVTVALNADTVRPLTDIVTVRAAEIRPYKIRAQIYVYPGPDSAVVLANAQKSAAAFAADNFKLGRDITMSGLYAALHVAGVQRVEFSEPLASIVNTAAQTSRCDEITITLAGTDE